MTSLNFENGLLIAEYSGIHIGKRSLQTNTPWDNYEHVATRNELESLANIPVAMS